MQRGKESSNLLFFLLCVTISVSCNAFLNNDSLLHLKRNIYFLKYDQLSSSPTILHSKVATAHLTKSKLFASFKANSSASTTQSIDEQQEQTQIISDEGSAINVSSSSTFTSGSTLEESESKGLPPLKCIKGVIFDMDGTLIKHCIDFSDMRKRIYQIADNDEKLKDTPESSRRGDVLELYHHFSEEGQRKAKTVFDDIESKAIHDMTLMEGVKEISQFLDSKGIKRAVLTRNVLKSVNAMHDKLWEDTGGGGGGVKEFFPVVSRETLALDGVTTIPSKPSPDAIFHICNVWNCSPEDVIMVGDSDADDIVAASRAGCSGKVLLRLDGQNEDNDAGGGGPKDEDEKRERQPSLIVHSLQELLEKLRATL